MKKNSKQQQTASINLPVSEPHGIPMFTDFLNEAQRRFNVEMNAKNEAYAFILGKGLFNEFADYSKTQNDTGSPNGHSRSIKELQAMDAPEN